MTYDIIITYTLLGSVPNTAMFVVPDNDGRVSLQSAIAHAVDYLRTDQGPVDVVNIEANSSRARVLIIADESGDIPRLAVIEGADAPKE